MVERIDKIDELICRRVSSELQMRFPEEYIGVTKVETSKDLGFCKIWISSFKDIDKIIGAVSRESHDIRKTLAKKLELRKVPLLRFIPDYTEKKAMEIENIINKANES